MKIPPPINGLVEGMASCEQGSGTSFALQNVRPFDVSKEKQRIGQRPGTILAYETQISGASHPILYMTAITTTYVTAV